MRGARLTTRLSLRASVVLLVVVCVLAAQIIAVSLLLTFPARPPPALTPAQVAAAVLAPPAASPAGLQVTRRAAPPFGPADKPYTRLVARILASELAGRGVREIRVHSLSDAVSLQSRGAPPLHAASQRSDAVDLADAPFPSFATAVLGADGWWLVLTPPRPVVAPEHVRLASAFALSLLILMPLTWWAARRLTAPLQVLARASQALERDPAAAPLPLSGPREVRAAAAAFNAMQEGLARQMDERITLLGAIAHDLRTPLTSLRLRAESAPEDVRLRMSCDVARMDRLISDLLVYVRGARAASAREALDLAELIQTVVADVRLRGEDVRVLEVSPAPVLAEHAAVHRVLDNLVSNALAYAGGACIRVGSEDQVAFAEIHDNGPGIPAKDLEAVFEPFKRLETSRSNATGGVGLGLAIARSLARANGGDIDLTRLHPSGLCARLTLPLR